MHDGSQCWVCVKVPEHSVCKAVVDCPSSGFCCPLAATLNDAIGTTVFIHQPPCTLCSLLVRCVCVQLCCDNGCRSSNWAGAFDAGIEEPTGPKVLFADCLHNIGHQWLATHLDKIELICVDNIGSNCRQVRRQQKRTKRLSAR